MVLVSVTEQGPGLRTLWQCPPDDTLPLQAQGDGGPCATAKCVSTGNLYQSVFLPFPALKGLP